MCTEEMSVGNADVKSFLTATAGADATSTQLEPRRLPAVLAKAPLLNPTGAAGAVAAGAVAAGAVPAAASCAPADGSAAAIGWDELSDACDAHADVLVLPRRTWALRHANCRIAG